MRAISGRLSQSCATGYTSGRGNRLHRMVDGDNERRPKACVVRVLSAWRDREGSGSQQKKDGNFSAPALIGSISYWLEVDFEPELDGPRSPSAKTPEPRPMSFVRSPLVVPLMEFAAPSRVPASKPPGPLKCWKLGDRREVSPFRH